MYVATSTCLCLCLIILESIASYQLPSCITVCKRNDPNLSKCWQSNFEKLRTCPKELEKLNISSFDPLLPEESVFYRVPLHHMELIYIEFHNVKNFQILANTVDLQLNRITLEVQFNNLDHVFVVKANGSLLNFQFTKEKECCVEGNANVRLSFTFEGKRTIKNGKEHISFKNVDVRARAKYVKEQAYNCFVGNLTVDKIFSTLLNKRLDILLPLYDKFARESIGLQIAKFITYVYDTYPLDFLHPIGM